MACNSEKTVGVGRLSFPSCNRLNAEKSSLEGLKIISVVICEYSDLLQYHDECKRISYHEKLLDTVLETKYLLGSVLFESKFLVQHEQYSVVHRQLLILDMIPAFCDKHGRYMYRLKNGVSEYRFSRTVITKFLIAMLEAKSFVLRSLRVLKDASPTQWKTMSKLYTSLQILIQLLRSYEACARALH